MELKIHKPEDISALRDQHESDHLEIDLRTQQLTKKQVQRITHFFEDHLQYLKAFSIYLKSNNLQTNELQELCRSFLFYCPDTIEKLVVSVQQQHLGSVLDQEDCFLTKMLVENRPKFQSLHTLKLDLYLNEIHSYSANKVAEVMKNLPQGLSVFSVNLNWNQMVEEDAFEFVDAFKCLPKNLQELHFYAWDNKLEAPGIVTLITEGLKNFASKHIQALTLDLRGNVKEKSFPREDEKKIIQTLDKLHEVLVNEHADVEIVLTRNRLSKDFEKRFALTKLQQRHEQHLKSKYQDGSMKDD